MKFIIFILISIVLPALVSAQDWKTIDAGVTENLYAVKMADRNTGWISGDNGTILRTGDGGFHWSAVVSGTTASLRSVCHGSLTNVWACGTAGTILMSGDGGVTWTPQTSGTTDQLNSIFFVNSSFGVAVGQNNTIVRTTDGGATWNTVISAAIPAMLNSVYFTDETHGWAVANNGSIICSNDGGQTWTPQTSGTTLNLMTVHFTDAASGWAAGYTGIILHTSNGGTTWSSQSSGTTNALLTLSFSDSQFGVAAGNGGVILKTEDGGISWQQETSGITQTVRSSSAVTNRTVMAAGNAGTIMRQSVLNRICMVTVDTLTGKNKIIWDKVYDLGTEYIKILRLDGSNYSMLALVPFDNLSEYLDLTSTPEQHADQYSLQSVDSAGNESMLSPFHVTINLTVSQGVPSTTASLYWNHYQDESGDFNPSEYYIWRGSNPSAMSLLATVPSSVNIYNDENAFSQYYYFVTVEKPVPCFSTGNSKETGGPYSSSYSNMEENLSGISDPAWSAYRMNVFPNPSSGTLGFSIPETEKVIAIRITDTGGKSYEINAEKNNSLHLLNIENFTDGFYFIEVVAEKTYRSSFVLQKKQSHD